MQKAALSNCIKRNISRMEWASLKLKVQSLLSWYKINNLELFIDENEILHVHGRIKQPISTLNKHTLNLLSGEGIPNNLLVKWYHQSVGHSGTAYTTNKIRSSGYWIVKANSVVPSYIARCIRCWYLCWNVGEEKMADFPADRISREPTFKYLGLI